jgi:SprT-like protein
MYTYIINHKGAMLMSLTQAQLKQYAEKFLKETYGINLNIPLELNGRLKKSCGRFKSMRYSNGYAEAVNVEMNKFFVENNSREVVEDVLKHELVHYALFEQGKPCADGHHVFEGELKRLGIVSQNTIDKYNIKSKPVNMTIYKCNNCNTEHMLQRALKYDGKYHKCKCSGGLTNMGRKVVSF